MNIFDIKMKEVNLIKYSCSFSLLLDTAPTLKLISTWLKFIYGYKYVVHYLSLFAQSLTNKTSQQNSCISVPLLLPAPLKNDFFPIFYYLISTISDFDHEINPLLKAGSVLTLCKLKGNSLLSLDRKNMSQPLSNSTLAKHKDISPVQSKYTHLRKAKGQLELDTP